MTFIPLKLHTPFNIMTADNKALQGFATHENTGSNIGDKISLFFIFLMWECAWDKSQSHQMYLSRLCFFQSCRLIGWFRWLSLLYYL